MKQVQESKYFGSFLEWQNLQTEGNYHYLQISVKVAWCMDWRQFSCRLVWVDQALKTRVNIQVCFHEYSALSGLVTLIIAWNICAENMTSKIGANVFKRD